MSPPVTFYDQIAWGSAATQGDYAPYAWIRIQNQTGTGTYDLWGLLDTGADYLMLEMGVARRLGIDLSQCRSEPVIVASGQRAILPRTTVNMTILQQPVTVDAIFGIRGTALIGRTAILKAMDFGIDIDGWLYRLIKNSHP